VLRSASDPEVVEENPEHAVRDKHEDDSRNDGTGGTVADCTGAARRAQATQASDPATRRANTAVFGDASHQVRQVARVRDGVRIAQRQCIQSHT